MLWFMITNFGYCQIKIAGWIKMLYRFGEAINTRVNQSYVLNEQHRNGNPHRSQWTIRPNDEVGVFEHSIESSWISQNRNCSWGLYLLNEKPSSLGLSITKKSLWIAKFVESANIWHGYPANYRFHTQDRPHTEVLQDWRSCGYIRKHEISKIRSGKRCSLSD